MGRWGGADPAANGLVHDIARPEGNITVFPALKPSIIDKQLSLIKEVAPHVSRVAALFNSDLLTAGPYLLAFARSVSNDFGRADK
jgi:putative tryptophan/tyrosine transport system substrate-binding protein